MCELCEANVLEYRKVLGNYLQHCPPPKEDHD